MPRRHTKGWYNRQGIRVVDRPFFGLSESQKENRFDTVAWHEREIFLDEILKHPSLLVRKRAERASEVEMQLMIRAYKQGVDLAACTLERLKKAKEWHKLPRALTTYEHQTDPPTKTPAGSAAPQQPLASPPVVGTFADLSKTLDDIIMRASGIKPRPVRDTARKMPTAQAGGTLGKLDSERQAPPPEPPREARKTPHGDAKERVKSQGAIPEELDESDAGGGPDHADDVPKPDFDDIAAIREKLTRNGKVRLDVEALSAYILCPSFFAIANGMAPEWWQTRLLDSYALRLGCLASRQCGKSLVIAFKACAYAACNPGTTVLILAPTLRQSTELLSKILMVVMNAGLKVAASNQYQLILGGDKLIPGEGSRIVALPGSNEDSGASARGYAADMLVLEEASFLKDDVIASVLPSIAARPKAQLIGISSAGIIGSYFHSVMTSPQSRWDKMTVTAARSGRFTREQLEDMRHDLGAAKFAVEFECKWGWVGDSLYDAETMQAAFGNSIIDPDEPDEPDDLAFGHLDLEKLFAARPFDRRVA
ncbi:terminase large subunit domain-containing protein [Rhizobium sp. RAF56]|uniref:terminase large subunit domain-containing protein n=1 Tax=Rhizobium sp. RAF56 TaxID=3233062 RepID=UPI003F95CB2D